MIGIVCSISADKEASAGNYQFMLRSPNKLLPFISMLTSLLILGLGAVILASVGFGAGFIGFLHLKPFNLDFYFYAACILFLGSIFLYVLHLPVALRFGHGASLGLGFAESLVSALMLTGLGEGTWQFIPCAWGVRFVTYFMQYTLDRSSASFIIPSVRLGGGLCVV
jgi:ABC-2 type transport system permease protein